MSSQGINLSPVPIGRYFRVVDSVPVSSINISTEDANWITQALLPAPLKVSSSSSSKRDPAHISTAPSEDQASSQDSKRQKVVPSAISDRAKSSGSLDSSTMDLRDIDFDIDEVFSTESDSLEIAESGSRFPSETVHFRPFQEDVWGSKFLMLLDFKMSNGHCNVPNKYEDNIDLAQWVKRQRHQYKLKMRGEHSTLTDGRERALESAGFIWDAQKALWEERFNELVSYKEEHGNCWVPSRYAANPKLAAWAKCQRRHFRMVKQGDPNAPSSMSEERVERLESIGFKYTGQAD